MNFSDTITWTWQSYNNGYEVSSELLKDDIYSTTPIGKEPEIMLYEYVVIKSGEDFDDDPQLLVNPSTVFAHDDEEAKLLAMYSLAKNLPDVDPKSVEILVRPFARD